MAINDFFLFEEVAADISNIHDLDADDFRWALITNTPPAVNTASPNLADFTECTPGGQYVAVTAEPTGKAVNLTYTEADGVATADGDDVSWTQDASNPTNARCALLVNVSQGLAAVGYYDLGSAFDMTTGPLAINPNASGIFTVTIT